MDMPLRVLVRSSPLHLRWLLRYARILPNLLSDLHLVTILLPSRRTIVLKEVLVFSVILLTIVVLT